MAFNIEAARNDGATDTQIAEHLAELHGFNIDAARADGVSDADIADHLSQKSTTLAKVKNTVISAMPSTKTESVADRAAAMPAQEPQALDIIRTNGVLGRAKDIEIDRQYAQARDAGPKAGITDYKQNNAANTERRAQEDAAGAALISDRLAGRSNLSPEEEMAQALATRNESVRAAEIEAQQKNTGAARRAALAVLAKSDTEEGLAARQMLADEGSAAARANDQKNFANLHPVVSDTATDFRSGVAKVPGAISGIIDIAPALIVGGRPADKLFSAIGDATGFKPSDYAAKLERGYSDIRKQGAQDISAVWDDETKTWWDVTKAYANNPGVTAGNIIQSLPAMAAGGAIGRVAMLTKAGLAPAAMQKASVAAGATGEGAMMAGQQMDSMDRNVDPRIAALASLATGIMGAAVGKYSGALATKMGIRDVDTILAGGTANAAAIPFYKRIPAAMVQEGIIEEGSQSSMEQMLKNVAEDKPVMDGVQRAAVEGVLAGSAMGGTVAMPNGGQSNPAAGGITAIPAEPRKDAAVPADELLTEPASPGSFVQDNIPADELLSGLDNANAAPFPGASPGSLSSAANIAAKHGVAQQPGDALSAFVAANESTQQPKGAPNGLQNQEAQAAQAVAPEAQRQEAPAAAVATTPTGSLPSTPPSEATTTSTATSEASAAIKPLVESLVKLRRNAGQIKMAPQLDIALNKAKSALKTGAGDHAFFIKAAKQFAGKDAAIQQALTGIAEAIAPAKSAPKAKKQRAASTDLRGRIIQLGGINSKYASDATGEKRPGGAWKFAFGKNGRGLDDLASQLAAEGFNIDLNDPTDNGGVNQLAEMIRQHIGGERAFKATTQEAQAEAMAEYRDYVAMRTRAEELGIKVSGLGNRELADAIYTAEDAIQMDAIAEREAMQEEAPEISALADMIEDGQDVPFGDEVQTDDAALAEFLGEQDGKNYQTGGRGSEEGSSGQASQGAEIGARTGGEPQGGERPLLESYTSAEAVAREKQSADTAAEDKAAADRASEVPFTLSAQSQPKPSGVQAGMFTADGRASVATETKQAADPVVKQSLTTQAISPEMEKAIAKARTLGVTEDQIKVAGNDMNALAEAVGAAVMRIPSANPKAAQPASKAGPLETLLDKYENSGEISTVDELAGRIEALEDIPALIAAALEEYRQEQQDDRALSGRNDMDAAEAKLITAIRGTGSSTSKAGNVKPLYASRPVANAKDIIAWAESQGFKSTLPASDMHVTVAYSSKAMDGTKVPGAQQSITIDGGERTVEPLGDEGAVVLKFSSEELQSRWREYRDAGASWDYDGYMPHVTLTYKGGDIDLSKVSPYSGKIELGAEKQEPLNSDKQDEYVEVAADKAKSAKGAAKSKKLEVLKAQAAGKISGDQGAVLKELADAGEHAAVDEVLKPAKAAKPAEDFGAMWDGMTPMERFAILYKWAGSDTDMGDRYKDRSWDSLNIGEQNTLRSVLGKQSPRQTATAIPAEEQPANDYTLASHADMEARVREGAMSADEFKASFESLLKNKAGIIAELDKFTKPQLFEKYPGLAYRYKNEKKADGIEAVYRDMLQDYALGESLVYGMGRNAMEESLRAMVNRTTDESIAKFADNVKRNKAEREAARAEAMAGMENPETLEDYQRLMGAKAKEMGEGVTFQQVRMSLPLEQRAKFDELAAEFNRGERAKKKVAQQEQSLRAPGEAVETTEIIKTKHTKHGHDLWQFQMVQRVSPEEFKSLVTQAKRLGGDYSSYRGNGAIPGWQFRTEEAAKAFKALVAGDTEQAKGVMDARRDAYADDRSQSAVERLTEMADALDEKADASLNQERKSNTARRARFAASAEASANAYKAMAQTMRNIATGIENGTAKMLDSVRQKVQVEMLQGFVRTAFQEQFQKYADQEKNQPSIETADYAKYPSYTAYRSDLASLGRALLEVEGTMKLGQRLMKVADDVSDAYLKFAKENLNKVSRFSVKGGGELAAFKSKSEAEAAIARSGFNGKAIVLPFKRNENLIILSPSEAIKLGIWEGDNDKRISLSADFGEELVEKIGKAARRGAKVSVPWQFENAYNSRKRLAGMNIETAAELRAALREFIGLRETAKAPDKIKQMERAMIGRKNDGFDFFPTPAVAADDAIAAADIKEGMTVYEPQAGMGHIADRIREAGIEPDVGEIATDRRELLEAKGYNIVSSDFMDMRFEDTPNGEGYDRIIMNPPFSDRRDALHVQHAYSLLKPGGRLVSIMGEGVFFGQDKKAKSFREWLDSVGGTEEKLEQGTFMDPSLPVNTGVSARMVVIDKPESTGTDAPLFSQSQSTARNPYTITTLRSAINEAMGKGFAELLEATDKFKLITSEQIVEYLGGAAKFSKASQTDTPAFKAWFGDSKVVDADGNPLVVYHGTPSATFDIFKPETYFTPHSDIANIYTNPSASSIASRAKAEDAPAVYPAFLKIEKPFDTRDPKIRKLFHDQFYMQRGTGTDLQESGLPDWNDARDLAEWIQEEGLDFDGLIVDEGGLPQEDGTVRSRGISYIPFNPEQIKSATGNAGTFSPSNPDIRYSKDGRILAFVVDGKTFMVADNIGSDDSVGGLLRHELGVHAIQLGRTDEEFQNILKRIESMRKDNKKVQAAFDRVPSDTPAHLVTEEATGYLVESSPDLSIIQKLIARFRALLRKIGLKLPMVRRMQWFKWADSLSVNDVVYMAQEATKRAPETLKDAQSRGTFKSNTESESGRIAAFWMAVASNPMSFKYGKADQGTTSASEIAEQMSTSNVAVSGYLEGDGAYFTSENGYLHVVPANDKRNSEGGFAEYMIQSPGARSEGKQTGGGSLLYQAAQKWVYANGGKFVKDGKLTEINKLRVTSNMLSSALREGSTDHLDPDPDQGIVGWKEGDTANNIAALATREMEVSYERIPELNTLHYDSGKGRIVDAGGKVVEPIQIRALLKRADPQFAQGVGIATAARAIATRAALLGDGNLGRESRIGLLQSGVAFGETEPLYSRRESDQQNQLPPETNIDAARRVGQDAMLRFRVIQDWLKEQGVNLSEAADVYVRENLSKATTGNRIEDFRNFEIEPLIQKIAKAGFDLNDITDYLQALHVPEANARMRKIHNDQNATANGITDVEAKAALAEFKAMPKFAEFKALADEVHRIGAQTLEMRYAEGLVSEEQYDAYKATYQHWIPLRGNMQKQQGFGRGMSTNAKQKRRFGHEQRDEFIFENLVADRERAIFQIEHNKLGRAVANFILEAGNPDIGTISKPERQSVLKDSSYAVSYNGQILSAFNTKQDAQNYVLKTVSSKSGAIQGLALNAGDFDIQKTNDPHVAMMVKPMLAENEIQVYINGHAVRMQLNDPLLARAATNAGIEQLAGVMYVARQINGFLSKAYTAWSPDFLFVNPVRDIYQGSVVLTGKEGIGFTGAAMKNYAWAWGELWAAHNDTRKSDWVTRYRNAGGNTGGAYLSDIERVGQDTAAALQEFMGWQKTFDSVQSAALQAGDSPMKARNKAVFRAGIAGGKKLPVMGHFLRLMERLNGVFENTLRLATFKAAIEAGKTDQQAAVLAKDLMNFNRKGEIANQMGAAYIFFNPATQGSHVVLQSLTTSPHAGQARWLISGLMMTAFLLAEAARSGDDDDERDWRDIPDHVKARNLVVKFGDMQVTLPVAYGFGVFHSLGNAMSDLLHGVDSEKVSLEMATAMFENFSVFGNPLVEQDGKVEFRPEQLLPTVPKMAIAPSTNLDGLGRAIQPRKFKASTPDSQNMTRAVRGTLYADVADSLNDWTGGSKYQPGAIDVSPNVLKYWVTSITGGAGRFVGDTTNAALGAGQGVAPELANIPIVRKFVRESDVSDSRAAFWQVASKAKLASEAYRSALRDGDRTVAKQMLKEDGAYIELARMADAFSKLAGAKRNEIEKINASDIPLEEKKAKIRKLEVREQEIYDEFLVAFDKKTKKLSPNSDGE